MSDWSNYYAISRVILYVKDIEKVAMFYEALFGFVRMGAGERGWLELKSLRGGCLLALHQAGKGQKSGAAMKLVFGVKDVPAFIEAAALKGFKFGPLHAVREGPGHQFANMKDPAGNAISVSSRGMSDLHERDS